MFSFRTVFLITVWLKILGNLTLTHYFNLLPIFLSCQLSFIEILFQEGSSPGSDITCLICSSGQLSQFSLFSCH